MENPNRRLFTTLLAGWAGFVVLGVILRQDLAVQQMIVVIDRSYCEPQPWQTVVDRYQVLYQQHQKKQIQIQSVILFSALGEETLTTPLDPTAVQTLKTYGRKDPVKQQQLQARLRQQLQPISTSTSDPIEILSCPQ